MNVQELASDLEVDCAEVIAQCRNLGIEATAETPLTASTQALVRIGLSSPTGSLSPSPDPEPTAAAEPGGEAGSEPVPATEPPAAPDPGPAAASPEPLPDPEPEREPEPEVPATEAVPVAAAGGPGDPEATQAVPVAAGVAGAAPAAVARDLPPNVLASSPADLAAAIDAAPASVEDADHGPLRHSAEPAPDGARVPGVVPTPTGRISSAPPPSKPVAHEVHLDRAIRPSAVALAVAVVLVILAFQLAEAAVWASAALLIVAGGCLLDAIIGGSRARYRTSLHPDRYRGRLAASLITIGASVGLVAYSLMGWVIFRSVPANQGHLGSLGRTALVQRLRWTQQRTRLVAHTGWRRPAKDPGTCWTDPDPAVALAKLTKPMRRIEYGGNDTSCTTAHRYEVILVYSVSPRPDVPYPGVRVLQQDAAKRCGAALLARKAPKGWTVVADLPLRDWDMADHDVACLARAPSTVLKPLPSV